MRYKIVDFPLTPEPAIIKKHENFDLLLNHYYRIGNSPALRGAEVISIALSIIFLSYALLLNLPDRKEAEKIVTNERLKQYIDSNPVPLAPAPPAKEVLPKEEEPGEENIISALSSQLSKEDQVKKNPVNSASPYTAATPLKGFEDLYKYFSDSLKYPSEAQDSEISGEVIIEFTITSTGEVTEIEVTQSLTPPFDQEAVRLIRQMPEWLPAQLNGHPVKSRLSLPLFFDNNISKEDKL